MALVLFIPAAAQEPPKAHFHHIHLNATDPAAAIDFYSHKFDFDKSRILFTKVSDAPPWEIVSAIWHFGWGAEDMPATYKKQVDSGTRFQTPLTDISDLAGKPPGSFFFA